MATPGDLNLRGWYKQPSGDVYNGNSPYSAIGGGDYSLTANAGSFTLTGSSSSLDYSGDVLEDDYPDYWDGQTEGAGSNVGSGTTYYVSTTGSNSNNGSEGSPFLTPKYAHDQTSAGDTVIFEDGEYALSSQWRITRQGTESEPITYKARNARLAHISYSTVASEAAVQFGIYSGDWTEDNDFWIIFDGLEITGGSGHNLALTGVNHCTIKNCNLHDSGHDPIKNNSSANHNLYFNNKIHSSDVAGTGNSDGVDVTSSSYVILRNNTIYNITEGNGFYFKKVSQFCLAEFNIVYDVYDKSGAGAGESTPCYNSVIRHNIFQDIGQSGLSAFGSKGCVYHNNTCYGVGQNSSYGGNLRSAFRCSGAQQLVPTTENPNFVDNGFNDSDRYSEDLISRDNIFVVNHDIGGKAYMFDTGDPAFSDANDANTLQVLQLTAKNNLYYNEGTGATSIYNWKGNDEDSLGEWQTYTTALGREQEVDSIESDPAFLSTVLGNSNYMKLDSGSPALDSASDGGHIGAHTESGQTFGVDW